MAADNSPKALREKRAPIAAAIQRISDAGEAVDASGNYTEAWLKVNADYNALSRQIDAAETAARVTTEMSARVGDPRAGRGDYDPRSPAGVIQATDEQRTLALRAWCKRGGASKELTDAEEEACAAFRINARSQEIELRGFDTVELNELKQRWTRCHPSRAHREMIDYRATLTGGSGPAGGYLVSPTRLMTNLEINMLAFGGMRRVADEIVTTSGERMRWPTADDTSNVGVQLGESTTIGSSVDPSFGAVEWDAYKFSSKPILVPYELLEDSQFDLPGVLGNMLGERLGRITNTKYTTGTGAATPKGIMVCAALGKTAASSTAIAADELFDLVHSIDPAYRSMGCGWMMHDNILLALRKLKDGVGNYMWQSGLQENAPDKLLTYPITINQDMASTIATGNKTLLFGLLNHYKIRRVNGTRLYRLQERYRDTDQDAFVAFIREDGNMLTSATVPVKYYAQA